MARSLGYSLLVAGSLGMLAGCGSSDGGGGTALEEIPAVYATAACDKFETCVPVFGPIFLGGGTCQDRIQRMLEDSLLPLWEAGVVAGTILYDGTLVADCIAAIDAGGCEIFDSGPPAACQAVFGGTVAPGGACVSSAECEGDRICRTDAMCPGLCADRAIEGESCVDSESCSAGLICSNMDVCTTPALVGESCNGPSGPPCQSPARCEESSPDGSGVRVSIADGLTEALGAPCDLEAGLLCQEGLFCVLESLDPATGASFVCAAASASAGACNAGLPDPCPVTEFCNANPTAGTITGTCTPLPVAGEDCAPSILGDRCAAEHVCTDLGTCAAMERLGGACSQDEICYNGNCVSGVCAQPVCE
ncbi:MAG: hypothetical protein OEY14_16190 [Myxococcales bacterium]|nr:hypothetical protein [Myxococcales bacterium]